MSTIATTSLRCGIRLAWATKSSWCSTTGAALGFDWAMRNRDRVQGIVYMEAIVTPLTWADWPENARRAFQGFRSESGEEMVLEKNIFVERVLPGSVIRRLSEEEMAAYRRPFA